MSEKKITTHQRKMRPMRAAQRAGMPWRYGGVDYDLGVYSDLWQVRFITKYFTTPRQGHLIRSPRQRRAALRKWYGCPELENRIARWLTSGKRHALVPTLDHKTPLCRGGTHTLGNLQWLTLGENMAKGKKNQREWLASQRRQA